MSSVEESNTKSRRKTKLSSVLCGWWMQAYKLTESRGYFHLSLGPCALLRLLPSPQKKWSEENWVSTENHTLVAAHWLLHIPLLKPDFNIHKINVLWDDDYNFSLLWHPVLPDFLVLVGPSKPLCIRFFLFFITVFPSEWDIISGCQRGNRRPDILIYTQLCPSLGLSISSGHLPHTVNMFAVFCWRNMKVH